MNLRNVLRAYSLLRVLSDDETALLETLRTANDNERQLIAEAMGSKPPQKKAGKKSAGEGGGGRSSSKSKHASSLAEKVGGTLASIAKTAGGDDESARKVLDAIDEGSSERCHFTRADGNPCKLLPDHNIHHMTTANEYHEFQLPTTTGKSDAQSAAGGGD